MNQNMVEFLYRTFVYIIAMLTALPFHEFAHAWAANKMGDSTARWQGRLTLNPLKHLDPIGSLTMIFVGIGWAKPVPINPYNFKNPKRGMALSSLAGPLSNMLLAFLCLIAQKLIWIFGPNASGLMLELMQNLNNIFGIMVSLNISLAVFNLIPVPPLDGSRVLTLFLPERTYFKIMQYERMIMIFLMFALFAGVLDRPLSFCRGFLYQGLDFLTGFMDIIGKMVAG